MVDQRYQGRGYGRQALLLMIRYLQESLHVTKINITHRKPNTAAGCLYDSLGFRVIAEDKGGCRRQLDLEKGENA